MQLIHPCDANKKSLQRYFFSGEKQEGAGEEQEKEKSIKILSEKFAFIKIKFRTFVLSPGKEADIL